MKNIFSILLAGLLCPISTFAQTINYQGIARNAQGAPLANKPIAVRLSIKDAASGGTALYSETKSVITNEFGLYTISINDGNGTRTGNFNTINWSAPRYLQTEIDPANGSAFADMGTSLMQRVPMAIVAENLKGISDPQDGDMLVYRQNEWHRKPAPQLYQIFGFGSDPNTIVSMLSTPIMINVNHPNSTLHIDISKLLGSTKTGGGTGLNLALGFRRTDVPNQPFELFLENGWLTGYRMSIGNRTSVTFSGTYKTLWQNGSYEIGIIGRTTSDISTASWNANGQSSATVEVEY